MIMIKKGNGYKESQMFILFEKTNSRGGDEICNYDCMGYATDEKTAIEWQEKNSEYRTYKYCPNINKNL